MSLSSVPRSNQEALTAYELIVIGHTTFSRDKRLAFLAKHLPSFIRQDPRILADSHAAPFPPEAEADTVTAVAHAALDLPTTLVRESKEMAAGKKTDDAAKKAVEAFELVGDLLKKKGGRLALTRNADEASTLSYTPPIDPAPHYKILQALFPFNPAHFKKEQYIYLCYFKIIMELQELIATTATPASKRAFGKKGPTATTELPQDSLIRIFERLQKLKDLSSMSSEEEVSLFNDLNDELSKLAMHVKYDATKLESYLEALETLAMSALKPPNTPPKITLKQKQELLAYYRNMFRFLLSINLPIYFKKMGQRELAAKDAAKRIHMLKAQGMSIQVGGKKTTLSAEQLRISLQSLGYLQTLASKLGILKAVIAEITTDFSAFVNGTFSTKYDLGALLTEANQLLNYASRLHGPVYRCSHLLQRDMLKISICCSAVPVAQGAISNPTQIHKAIFRELQSGLASVSEHLIRELSNCRAFQDHLHSLSSRPPEYKLLFFFDLLKFFGEQAPAQEKRVIVHLPTFSWLSPAFIEELQAISHRCYRATVTTTMERLRTYKEATSLTVDTPRPLVEPLITLGVSSMLTSAQQEAEKVITVKEMQAQIEATPIFSDYIFGFLRDKGTIQEELGDDEPSLRLFANAMVKAVTEEFQKKYGLDGAHEVLSLHESFHAGWLDQDTLQQEMRVIFENPLLALLNTLSHSLKDDVDRIRDLPSLGSQTKTLSDRALEDFLTSVEADTKAKGKSSASPAKKAKKPKKTGAPATSTTRPSAPTTFTSDIGPQPALVTSRFKASPLSPSDHLTATFGLDPMTMPIDVLGRRGEKVLLMQHSQQLSLFLLERCLALLHNPASRVSFEAESKRISSATWAFFNFTVLQIYLAPERSLTARRISSNPKATLIHRLSSLGIASSRPLVRHANKFTITYRYGAQPEASLTDLHRALPELLDDCLNVLLENSPTASPTMKAAFADLKARIAAGTPPTHEMVSGTLSSALNIKCEQFGKTLAELIKQLKEAYETAKEGSTTKSLLDVIGKHMMILETVAQSRHLLADPKYAIVLGLLMATGSKYLVENIILLIVHITGVEIPELVMNKKVHLLRDCDDDYGLCEPLEPAETAMVYDLGCKFETLYEGMANQTKETPLMKLLSNLYAASLAACTEGGWTPAKREPGPSFAVLQEQFVASMEHYVRILGKLAAAFALPKK